MSSIRWVCLAALAVALLPAAAGAGPIPPLTNITWGSATNIAGDSDVDTTGSLVYAYNFGDVNGETGEATTTTVNGVTFLPFGVATPTSPSVTTGNVTVTETASGYFLASVVGHGSASPPFGGLTSQYQALLTSGVYSINTDDIMVDLGGLTTGHSYRLQVWTNNSNDYYNFLFDQVLVSGATTNVTLDTNVTDSEGGLGQYVIGTFVAPGSTAHFTLTGTPAGLLPLLNGLQLRDASSPVPEIDPAGMGSVVALVTGALGLLERRRTKAQARAA